MMLDTEVDLDIPIALRRAASYGQDHLVEVLLRHGANKINPDSLFQENLTPKGKYFKRMGWSNAPIFLPTGPHIRDMLS